MTQRSVPIDLETTGLHPVDDRILEFAMLLLDHDLNTVAEFGSRVVHANEPALARMNDYVRDMHVGTGLLDAVRQSSLSLSDVDEEASEWLSEHGVGESGGIPLGSSCRLDLYMVELQMPRVATSRKQADPLGRCAQHCAACPLIPPERRRAHACHSCQDPCAARDHRARCRRSHRTDHR